MPTVERLADVDAFVEAAGEFLAAREAEYDRPGDRLRAGPRHRRLAVRSVSSFRRRARRTADPAVLAYP
jgi:hypothetical protein